MTSSFWAQLLPKTWRSFNCFYRRESGIDQRCAFVYKESKSIRQFGYSNGAWWNSKYSPKYAERLADHLNPLAKSLIADMITSRRLDQLLPYLELEPDL